MIPYNHNPVFLVYGQHFHRQDLNISSMILSKTLPEPVSVPYYDPTHDVKIVLATISFCAVFMAITLFAFIGCKKIYCRRSGSDKNKENLI